MSKSKNTDSRLFPALIGMPTQSEITEIAKRSIFNDDPELEVKFERGDREVVDIVNRRIESLFPQLEQSFKDYCEHHPDKMPRDLIDAFCNRTGTIQVYTKRLQKDMSTVSNPLPAQPIQVKKTPEHSKIKKRGSFFNDNLPIRAQKSQPVNVVTGESSKSYAENNKQLANSSFANVPCVQALIERYNQLISLKKVKNRAEIIIDLSMSIGEAYEHASKSDVLSPIPSVAIKWYGIARYFGSKEGEDAVNRLSNSMQEGSYHILPNGCSSHNTSGDISGASKNNLHKQKKASNSERHCDNSIRERAADSILHISDDSTEDGGRGFYLHRDHGQFGSMPLFDNMDG